MMTDKIGNVTIDYTYYSGQDLYSDGDIEDVLYEAVRDEKTDLRKVYEEGASWPLLYHLSSYRQNIVSWIPMTKRDKVLEVGSGCGAITGALAQNAGQVDCIELSKKRSLINAHRNRKFNNVCIHVGNFKDIEEHIDKKYDFIYLIGVLEYSKAYIGGENPYVDFLNILKKHLAPNGRIVIAIENKMGLKYLAGAKEDHVSRFFTSIEGYKGIESVETMTKEGLRKICRKAGFKKVNFYYPYPDYKFPSVIYSDKRMPAVGELNDNIRNFDNDRLVLFNETDAFNEIIKDGYFDIFSNSYLLILGEDVNVIYSKYSNESRQDLYAIRTSITEDIVDKKIVKKVVKTTLGPTNAHINDINIAYEGLKRRYYNYDVEIQKCNFNGFSVDLEYAEGTTLDTILDECIRNNDKEKFLKLFDRYKKLVDYNKEAKVWDIDLIFSNILVDGNRWTIIDYEWTYLDIDCPVDIVNRALYYFLVRNDSRREILKWDLGVDYIFREKEIAAYETQFQQSIVGETKTLSDMVDAIGYRRIYTEDIMDACALRAPQIQIYYDDGAGYKEETSCFVPATIKDDIVSFKIKVNSGTKNLRIDPGFGPCSVDILSITSGERNLTEDIHYTLRGFNGKRRGKSMLFKGQDPHFGIKVSGWDLKDDDVLDVAIMYYPINEGALKWV